MFNRIDRRQALWTFGGGLGGIALNSLLQGESPPGHDWNGGLHHKARARRVIQLFMNGGVSQCDTFDYKPELAKRHGQTFDPGAGQHVEAVTSTPGKVMQCPFPFRQYGQCGRWVSSVFPHLSSCVDDMALLLGVSSKTSVHGPSSYVMNTGFILPGFPCLGAWISYGLGRISDDLPTFVVLPDPRGLPYNNLGNFSSGFLPVVHQGTVIRPHQKEPVAFLRPPESARRITQDSEADALSLLARMNREHAALNPGDSRMEARISSYELAARMQLAAPEALDLNKEPVLIRRMYGMEDPASMDFGRNCLTARRLIERGVRFVQVWSGAGGPSNNWDNHGSIQKELPPIATSVDRPIAGLLQDLKQRGLLDDTLVVFSTEFGRHPFSQGSEGRDHNGGTGLAWLAGAGIRGGTVAGESDEWSWQASRPILCYDIHATILHLLGIDHTRLTFRHNGTDRRLTDVHGHLIEDILA